MNHATSSAFSAPQRDALFKPVDNPVNAVLDKLLTEIDEKTDSHIRAILARASRRDRGDAEECQAANQSARLKGGP